MRDAKADPRAGDVFVKKSPSGKDVFRFVKGITHPQNNKIVYYSVKEGSEAPYSIATEKEWNKWAADAEVRSLGEE